MKILHGIKKKICCNTENDNMLKTRSQDLRLKSKVFKLIINSLFAMNG